MGAASDVTAANLEAAQPMDAPTVLAVDDDPSMLRAVRAILVREGYRVLTAEGGEDALAVLRDVPVDVVLADVQMPGMSGLELLRAIRVKHEAVQVVIMTAYGTVATAVRAVKEGAFNFLTKPFETIDQVTHIVRRAVAHKRLLDRNRYLESALEVRERYQDMVGKSHAMRELFELVDSVSYSASNVLIQGESGTGKELVARAVHARSPRKDKPFVVINCSALTETLLESELFGHEKGAFTGATAQKKGLFEAAHRGTIFLDEIGDIPASTQVKLLRVLQEGDIKRVGSNDVIRVDVRTLAATNVDLHAAMREGRFREDLYYRLNVINIEIPPLRERVEDIPLLAYHMLKRYAARMEKEVRSFAPLVVDVLQTYHWPGNVRELENVVERAVVLCRGDVVELQHLPGPLRDGSYVANAAVEDFSGLDFTAAKKLAVQAFERRYVMQLLARTAGNISEASRRAGLDRSNFRRVLKRHNVDISAMADD